MKTPYAVLGVPRHADDEAIRTAFRSAAKAHHPDLNAGDKVAEQSFRQIVAAYEVLKDPQQRRAYHLSLRNRRFGMTASVFAGLMSWRWSGRDRMAVEDAGTIPAAAVAEHRHRQGRRTPGGGRLR